MPEPTLSPRERMRHLAAFNNYLNLFRGTCAATGEPIIQNFRPGVPFPVYSTPYWWGDTWDARTYGRPYDFSRTFLSQFADLASVVPWPALTQNFRTNENCEYVNGVSFSRRCYLAFSTIGCEDCLFIYMNRRCRDLVECSFAFDCELCYDSVFIFNGYDLRHCFNCRSCRSSEFLRNCVGCQECFGCVNLNQGRFVFFNEQLSEKEYRARTREFVGDDIDSVEQWRRRFEEHAKRFPDPAVRGLFLENASGDFIDHCGDVVECYQGAELDTCINCLQVEKGKDILNMYTWGANAELVYNGCRIGTDVYDIRNSHLILAGSSDIEYSMLCVGSRHCFGCVGMRNAEYAIFNREYSKQDYEDLRARIVAQMKNPQNGEPHYGEYFPLSLSRHPYNDSDAMVYFPLDKGAIERIGGRYEEPVESSTPATISWSTVPARSSEIGSAITRETLACEVTGKPFRIIPRELEIYHARGYPLPRKHWLERLSERMRRAQIRC